VEPGGPAAEAGIEPGDVIEEVNRQPVRSVDELRAAVRESDDRPALVLVDRKGASLFLTLRPSA
jgi:S1-C subfamily serine protease